jgi:hypothetical protein
MRKMLLPCDLEPIEVTEFGEKLALLEERRGELQAEKKEFVADINDQLKSVDAEMSTLAKAVRDKKIEREVETKTIPDTDKWEMVTLRQDTGEEIDRREMSDRERMKHGQMELVVDNDTEEAKAEQDELDDEAEAG